MKEVTMKVNKFMHPRDADHKQMMAFSNDMPGEIKLQTISCSFRPNSYWIVWNNGIVSPTFPSIEEMVSTLESKNIKFYHL